MIYNIKTVLKSIEGDALLRIEIQEDTDYVAVTVDSGNKCIVRFDDLYAVVNTLDTARQFPQGKE